MTLLQIDLKSDDEKTVELGANRLVVGPKRYEGDICNLYEATFFMPAETVTKSDWTWFDLLNEEDEEIEIPALLKVCKKRSDADLVQNEIQSLSALFPPGKTEESFYRYFPKFLGSFETMVDKAAHQSLLLFRADSHVTFADVLRAFPSGLDFQDMVWMWKRVLEGIGFAHYKGLVHGAVLPPHMAIHPTAHGIKIVDWSYSTAWKTKPRVRAMSAAYEAYYAPEILDRKDVSPATDIYMSAKCVVALLGGDVEKDSMPDNVPKEIQAFILECLVKAPRMRPQSAWDLVEAFDKLLLKLVGKPTYRPLKMP